MQSTTRHASRARSTRQRISQTPVGRRHCTRRDHRAALLLWCATTVVALLGCSAPAVDRGAIPPCPAGGVRADTLTITATATSAEPRVAVPEQVRQALVAQPRQHDACVVLVFPDGKHQAYSLTPRRANGEPENGSGSERLLAENVARIEAKVAGMAAEQPGLDVLNALQVAKAGAGASKHLVLVTSGLSTVSPVQLQSAGWNAKTRAWVTMQITRADGLRLDGFTVDLAGLGDTAGRQPAISAAARQAVTALWMGLCSSVGAACSDLGPMYGRPAPIARNPVPVVHPPAPEQSVMLEGKTLFDRDRASVGSAFDDQLRRLIAAVRDTMARLDVTGYTDASTGSARHNQALSERRAQSVRERLLFLGLPTTNLGRVRGAGSADFSAEQEQANPRLIEKHRSVLVEIVAPQDLPNNDPASAADRTSTRTSEQTGVAP